MTDEFSEHIANLMDDYAIDDETKRSMLTEWKEKLISHNSDRIMDKVEAEKHFKWIGIIDSGINCLDL